MFVICVSTCIVTFSSFAPAQQNGLTRDDSTTALKYITSYPVKIDGGCSFITYDSLPLKQRKFIFIISARQDGFMELENGEASVILKQVSKESLPDKTSVETFAGQGYKAVLKRKEAKGTLEDWPYYKGTLQIRFQKKTKVYKIHGTKS